MLRQPRYGQRVRLRYRPSLRAPLLSWPGPPHLAVGIVQCVGHGRGPHNVEVLLEGGRFEVVPRGQLELVR
jgi:hypothetical protein